MSDKKTFVYTGQRVEPYTFEREQIEVLEIAEGVTIIPYAAFKGQIQPREIRFPSTLKSIDMRAFEFNNDPYARKINSIDYKTDVILPEGLKQLEENAFSKMQIGKLYIPDSIKNIPKECFDYAHIDSVRLPKELKYLGEKAFGHVGGLDNVTLPGSLNFINHYTFAYSGIKHLKLEEGITDIPQSSFSGCRDLESVELPDSLSHIHYDAFNGCESLKEVKIGDGMRNIEASAFENTGIEYAYIPDTVRTLGKAIFKGCKNLKSVHLPENDNIIEIGNEMFKDCRQLEEVNIPSNVFRICLDAFGNCESLKHVELPEKLSNIANSAFHHAGLESIKLGPKVIEVGSSAFLGNLQLESIDLSETQLSQIESGVFSRCPKIKEVKLPDKIRNIGTRAFSDSGYEAGFDIVIPDHVTYIQSYAFEHSGVRNVTLPESINDIQTEAFKECYQLTNINIPGNLCRIGHSAFDNTGLKEVNIPEGRLCTMPATPFKWLSPDRTQSGYTKVTYREVDVTGCTLMESDGENGWATAKQLVDNGATEADFGEACTAEYVNGHAEYVCGLVVKPTIDIPLIAAGLHHAHMGTLQTYAENWKRFGPTMEKIPVDVCSEENINAMIEAFKANASTGHRVPKVVDCITAAAAMMDYKSPNVMVAGFDLRYMKKVVDAKVPVATAVICGTFLQNEDCLKLIESGMLNKAADLIVKFSRTGRSSYFRAAKFIAEHPASDKELLSNIASQALLIFPDDERVMTMSDVKAKIASIEALSEVEKIGKKYDIDLYSCKSSIPVTQVTEGGLTARTLDFKNKDDINLASILGYLTGCCQHLEGPDGGGEGETAMMHSFLNPDGGFWVIEDKNRKVVAQSALWVDSETGSLVFDNIEFEGAGAEGYSKKIASCGPVMYKWLEQCRYDNVILGKGYSDINFSLFDASPEPTVTTSGYEKRVLLNAEYREDEDEDEEEYDSWDKSSYESATPYIYTDTDSGCVYIKHNGVSEVNLMSPELATSRLNEEEIEENEEEEEL